LCGAEEVLDHIKHKLGIGIGEVTADGKFGLREAECMGACIEAPLLTVNNKRMCFRLTPAKVDQIIAELDK
jgi:NADH-quinone oxidoreductase subunit E